MIGAAPLTKVSGGCAPTSGTAVGFIFTTRPCTPRGSARVFRRRSRRALHARGSIGSWEAKATVPKTSSSAMDHRGILQGTQARLRRRKTPTRKLRGAAQGARNLRARGVETPRAANAIADRACDEGHRSPHLTSTQLDVLRACSDVKLGTKPTCRDALLAVPALGGHIKNNGDPGWQVLARGYERLIILEEAWVAASGTATRKRKT